MSLPTSHSSRSGSGELSDSSFAKGTEVKIVKPLHRRRWVRLLVFCFACATGLAGAGALAWFNQWHDGRLAEMERQRHCLQAFLHSPEFTSYVRAMDDQFVATLNFISVRPLEVHPLLAEIAARDKARHEMPWTMQVMPLPISSATDPARIAQAGQRVNALLVQHGFVVDEAARKAARQTFLRTFVPYAQKFIRREPGNVFQSVFLDRTMQEEALSVFTHHHGPEATVAGMERFFILYAAVGPAMWRAIEQENARRNPAAVTAAATTAPADRKALK